MFPLSKGKVAKQAHVGLPDGTFEEEHGREAFDGRASHLYRMHFPTAWVRIEGPLQPRAYDLNGLKPSDMADAAGDWQRILHNDDLAVFVSRRQEAPSWFLRDPDGDLLVLPKGTTHRVAPDAGETFLYAVESRGEYHLPDRGLLGRHALFDPGVIETPEPDPHDQGGEFEVRVKRGGEYTSLTYPFHPLDVVGWQGDLCPLRINRED